MYGSPINQIKTIMRLNDQDLISRFVYDEENPDYVIVTDKCWEDLHACRQFKRYWDEKKKNRIFIFFTFEAMEPELNLCDYAFTWNPYLKCADRICHNFSYMYDELHSTPFKNELTLDDARKILQAGPGFCNFLYSHAQEPRDSFFHLLSRYKHVDSSGPHLNNTGIRSSREAKNWYDLSIDMKRGYKFSIAMENNSCIGYTTEKIVTSLQAHTIPIYWGDPAVADYINPKAFINCGDYSSFDEVIDRVREIDNNDELWLDMVTQPWQTDEQYAKTIQEAEDYNSFIRSIFSQDIVAARRRATGFYAQILGNGFTGAVGKMPSFMSFVMSKVKRVIKNGDFKSRIKKTFRINY